MSSTVTSDGRYSIRIYALCSYASDPGVEGFAPNELCVVGVPKFLDKSIKASNLHPCPELLPEEIYKPGKDFFAQAADQCLGVQPPMSDNDMEFWLEAHHVLRGQASFGLSITFAAFLRDRKQQKQRAAQLLEQVLEQHQAQIQQDPRFCLMCRDFVYTFTDAGQDFLEKALTYALTIADEEGQRPNMKEGITTLTADGREDTRNNRSLRRDALAEVIEVASKIVQENRGLGSTQHVAKVELKACQALVAMEPANPSHAYNLGVAFAHCHEPRESARWYRHAVTLGYSFDDVRGSLLLSQLECPGMLLDGYHVLAEHGRSLTCVRKEHLNNIVADPSAGGFRLLADADVVKIELPTDDPNNPMFDELVNSLESVTT